MKELQTIVNGIVEKMIKDNTIQAIIEKSVQGAITEAIASQFKSYGSITKQIEKAIEDGLKIDTKNIPFESYNEQMLVIIKQRLGDMFKGIAAEKFMSEMDGILAPAPAEISINELVEVIVSFWKTDEPWEADDLDEQATVDFEENEYGGFSVKMWKQAETLSTYSRRKNSADLELYISGKDTKTIRINHHQSYNPTCFDQHEAFIFKLYAAGTVITGLDSFDPDDCELTLKELDY